MVATRRHFQYYNSKRKRLYVSKSIRDPMRGNAYQSNVRRDEGYGNVAKVQEWTAVYYGTCSQCGATASAKNVLSKTETTVFLACITEIDGKAQPCLWWDISWIFLNGHSLSYSPPSLGRAVVEGIGGFWQSIQHHGNLHFW